MTVEQLHREISNQEFTQWAAWFVMEDQRGEVASMRFQRPKTDG